MTDPDKICPGRAASVPPGSSRFRLLRRSVGVTGSRGTILVVGATGSIGREPVGVLDDLERVSSAADRRGATSLLED